MEKNTYIHTHTRTHTCTHGIKGTTTYTASALLQLVTVSMEEINSIASASGVSIDHSENTPLLQGRMLVRRYGNTRKCVSSNAALLILLWSFVVGLLGAILLNPDLYARLTFYLPVNDVFVYIQFGPICALSLYGVVIVLTCFFPLAGILADIRYGRYTTVITSLFIVFLSVLLAAGVGGIATLGAFFSFPLAAVCGVLGCVLVIMLYVGLIGFTANIVQFGMDQLHDSPGEDSTLFIHWYVWTYYFCFFITMLTLMLGLPPLGLKGLCLLLPIPVVVVIVLAITLYLVRHRRRWFLIEPGGLNPYKLVYRVTKFARQHNVPVQRSAFTYCEDELPSGLDLGKEKYGGCFTTEQVEDVKAFYGILKVLFSFGVVFFLGVPADSILPLFIYHISGYIFNARSSFLLSSGLISPLLIVVCIPLYICLLRPFFSRYVPGMLKRMGLGMLFVLLSLIASFSMDMAEHLKDNNNNTCMLNFGLYNNSPDLPPLNSSLLLIQLTLLALSNMLIYTAVFEFICSQSPRSMKGLLIGLLYAIKGLYQLLATLLPLSFTVFGMQYYTIHHISCGFYYYLTNIVIGVVALLVYTCVAKRYRYRVRDELCNVHQYAENYYSNQQYS